MELVIINILLKRKENENRNNVSYIYIWKSLIVRLLNFLFFILSKQTIQTNKTPKNTHKKKKEKEKRREWTRWFCVQLFQFRGDLSGVNKDRCPWSWWHVKDDEVTALAKAFWAKIEGQNTELSNVGFVPETSYHTLDGGFRCYALKVIDIYFTSKIKIFFKLKDMQGEMEINSCMAHAK